MAIMSWAWPLTFKLKGKYGTLRDTFDAMNALLEASSSCNIIIFVRYGIKFLDFNYSSGHPWSLRCVSKTPEHLKLQGWPMIFDMGSASAILEITLMGKTGTCMLSTDGPFEIAGLYCQLAGYFGWPINKSNRQVYENICGGKRFKLMIINDIPCASGWQ